MTLLFCNGWQLIKGVLHLDHEDTPVTLKTVFWSVRLQEVLTLHLTSSIVHFDIFDCIDLLAKRKKEEDKG